MVVANSWLLQLVIEQNAKSARFMPTGQISANDLDSPET